MPTQPKTAPMGKAVLDPDRFFAPDPGQHRVARKLYSQGVPVEALGIPRCDGGAVESDYRKIWQTLAEHFYLFRGTPSGVWVAGLVARGLVDIADARDMATDMVCGLAKRTYRLWIAVMGETRVI